MTNESLNKEEVALRLIDQAIHFHIYDCDPVCTHLLAQAGANLVRDVCIYKGIRPYWSILEEIKGRDELREFWKWKNSAYNFFKHAKDDADATLELFDEGWSDVILFGACIDYQNAFRKVTPSMWVFRGWINAMNPQLFSMPPAKRAALNEIFPPETLDSRANQKESVIRVMEMICETLPNKALTESEFDATFTASTQHI